MIVELLRVYKMQVLKKILRIAVEKKFSKVFLSAGKPVSFYSKSHILSEIFMLGFLKIKNSPTGGSVIATIRESFGLYSFGL